MALRLILVTTLAWLTGCASTQAPTPATVASSASFEGRISITQPQRRDAGGFGYWRQGQRQQWDFFGPTGGELGRLVIEPDLTQWHPSKGESISAQDPQALARDALGVDLPLQYAAQWMMGEPADPPRLNGWTLSYPKRDELGRPRIVDLIKDDIRVRAVIKQWQYNPN